jgi:hypothetical protein
MNPSPSPSGGQDRLLELLADQATQGLPVAEQAELDLLRRRYPEVDDTELEVIAAELALSLDPPAGETLPHPLREQIERQLHNLQGVVAQPGVRRPRPLSPPPGAATFLSTLFAWGGWVAAAACLSVLLWNRWAGGPLSPTQMLASWKGRSDVLRVKGQAPNPAGNPNCHVEVHWCPFRHEGCLHLHGLPVNDPTKDQYQLWIYDARRDPRYPIDGGVFDVSSDGEAIVQVRAKLRVYEPIRFVVTRECCGGVVVSEGERLLLAELKR